MRSIRALTPFVGAALGVALASPARADARCASLVVEADESLGGLEAELPERVRRALENRAGIDTCARVKLGRRAAAITVDVQLEDGRRATRTVPERDDVVLTLEALLFVPEPAAEAEAARPATELQQPDATGVKSPPATRARAMAAPLEGRLGVDAAAREPSEEDADGRLGIELSVITGARFGDGQSSVGLGALSLLELGGWLAGIEARADGYAITSSAARSTLELAVLAGRRSSFEAVTLDLVAGPALAFTGESTTETGPSPMRTETSPGFVPRLLARCHLNLAPRSVLRTFIGLDAELGARGPAEDGIQGGSPGLPVWVVGLALGATLGTR